MKQPCHPPLVLKAAKAVIVLSPVTAPILLLQPTTRGTHEKT